MRKTKVNTDVVKLLQDPSKLKHGGVGLTSSLVKI